MKIARAQAYILLSSFLASFPSGAAGEEPRDKAPRVTVVAVRSQAVTITQQYVCRLHAQRHIDVRVPTEGYVAALPIREDQAVKTDDLLFRMALLLGQQPAGIKDEDKLLTVKAPFDGMVGRLSLQQGSLVQKGEILTTLADNSVIRAEFQVPEGRYLEDKAKAGQTTQSPTIELLLANGVKFDQPGKLATIGADFDETGNVVIRADFPNPTSLLRHGQTGTVLISRVLNDAVVVPRRATFDVLDRRYVYVVDAADIARQREVAIRYELDDLLVIQQGVRPGDKVVVEGTRRVRDGVKVAREDR